MRIAQISDLHYTHVTWNPFRLLSKRLLGFWNWVLFRDAEFFPEQLELLPSLFRDLNVDLVLLGGDFTTTSLLEEFEKAKQLVKKISQPWIAIPGNHDHYTRRSYRKKHFYRYFTNKRKEIAHPAEFFNLKDHAVEAHSIKPGWWLIALDTARATNLYSSQGLFSEKMEEYCEEILKLIPPNDSVLLFSHYPFFQNEPARRCLERGEELEKMLERHPRVRLFLHGHTHRHTIADLQPNNLPLILDSGSCAHRKRGSWNLIDLQSDGCTVSAYQWKNGWREHLKKSVSWSR